MAELLTACPVCKGNLTVSALSCDDCGLSLQNQFHLNLFNYLSAEQMTFLLSFLKHQGNLKLLQDELNISYLNAKKKLQLLLQSLNLATVDTNLKNVEEKIDMTNLIFSDESPLASNVIKRKMYENSGRAVVSSANGNIYEIRAKTDGIHFECDQLPISPPYSYTVFDSMVECLLQNSGRARKGNGRNYKLGEPECNDTTLVGYIAKHYAGKPYGSSVFDPIFVLVSVLEWAGIAHNRRGFVDLTKEFKNNQIH